MELFKLKEEKRFPDIETFIKCGEATNGQNLWLLLKTLAIEILELKEEIKKLKNENN